MQARKLKKSLKIDEDYYPRVSSLEAKICLNCPFERCEQPWNGCDHYKKGLERIREMKNEKRRKKSN